MSTNEDLARDDSPQPSKDRGQHTAKLRHDEAAVSIPHNRLGLVFPSLMLCVFLAALDSTITAVAAPAICRELGCSSADFQWLASSYLLGSAAFMPMYGRLSDIVGRKPVMYSGILLFLLGSGLCGGAKNIRWMIGCRAIQGVGGGAIMSLTQVIISDIVTLQDRGRYASFLGSVWGYVDAETSCNKSHQRR
jgi:MFS family permease